MPKTRTIRQDKPYYLIPVALGMAGVLFSNQLEDPLLQVFVVMLCLGFPLFMGGNLFARIHSGGAQRLLLASGMVMLTVGAVVTLTGNSDTLFDPEMVPEDLNQLSRTIGIISLLLGTLAFLYSMVRSEAIIVALGDRFSHVADHISEGIILIDQNGRIILVNQSLLSMSGLKEEDLLGTTLRDINSTFIVSAEEKVVHPGELGNVIEYEVEWTRDNVNTYYRATSTPIFIKNRKSPGTIWTLKDVTAEHTLHEQLEEYNEQLQATVAKQTEKIQQSEKQFRDLLLNMREGFITIDKRADIRFVNDRFSEMIGISVTELHEHRLLDYMNAADAQRLLLILEQFAHDEFQHPEFESVLCNDNGVEIPVKISVAIVEESNDSSGQYSLVVTELTELKEMQVQLEHRYEDLEAVNEELRELDRAKDVFLSNVSHELRTPLGTLDGYLDMLQGGSLGELDVPQSGAIKVMQRNVQRLTNMINEMIESSRMEIRGLRLYYTLFNGRNLIRECVASAHPSAYQKDIELSVVLDSSLRFMWGDRAKLGQVITILLNNAIKFTPDNGKVTVMGSITDDDIIQIGIQDNGIGVETEYQDKIFQKFFQVDSSMTRKYEGTGIGLSIGKNILKAHGGTLNLESKYQQGATFTLSLPGSHFPIDLPERSVSESDTQFTVFVVNQLEEFRQACSTILNKLNIIVIEFSTGYEALRAARKTPPALIIIGESLPDISGVELSSLLSDDAVIRDVPVILLKSDTRDEDVVINESVHILEKPFSMETFKDTVESICGEVEAVENHGS
jgi:PAS domain S-box-containing protein